jgi:hypothetical protein
MGTISSAYNRNTMIAQYKHPAVSLCAFAYFLRRIPDHDTYGRGTHFDDSHPRAPRHRRTEIMRRVPKDDVPRLVDLPSSDKGDVPLDSFFHQVLLAVEFADFSFGGVFDGLHEIGGEVSARPRAESIKSPRDVSR